MERVGRNDARTSDADGSSVADESSFGAESSVGDDEVTTT